MTQTARCLGVFQLLTKKGPPLQQIASGGSGFKHPAGNTLQRGNMGPTKHNGEGWKNHRQQKSTFWEGACDRFQELCTPWKINGWNLQPSPI